ncbi:hypothetical protein ACIRRA_17840 [Nocardia sp. NPDC101769]
MNGVQVTTNPGVHRHGTNAPNDQIEDLVGQTGRRGLGREDDPAR